MSVLARGLINLILHQVVMKKACRHRQALGLDVLHFINWKPARMQDQGIRTRYPIDVQPDRIRSAVARDLDSPRLWTEDTSWQPAGLNARSRPFSCAQPAVFVRAAGRFRCAYALKQAKPVDSNYICDPELSDLLLPDPDRVLPAVVKTFRIRHIYAHELVPAENVKIEEIQDCFEKSVTFMHAALTFLQELGHPGLTANTQLAMNATADQRYQAALNEMESLVNGLSNRLDTKKVQKLKQAQKYWTKFEEAESQLELNPYEGGSGAPMWHYSAKTSVVLSRIEQLKAHKENLDWLDSL